MSERVFVAMSGGVDSSVTAAILADRGYDVVGVWMRLSKEGVANDAPRCCGTDEAGEEARRAAAHLGIPFYALDYADVFGRDVVDRFVDAYAHGETPNPCVACNAYVKFEALLRDVVAKFGAAFLATGHYARVVTDASGRHRLLRALDASKDQSYALYMLGQRELARVLFPIGELRAKEETRALAARYGLPNAAKAESMDICFVPGDHRDLVRGRAPEAFVSGPVERSDGTVVGRHDGLASLTVGQRRGVGVAAGERLYVLRLDLERNAAVVGTRAEVASRAYALRDVQFTFSEPPGQRFASTVALRYRAAPVACEVEALERGSALIRLAEPALVAPGQAAVLYEGDEVLGGGTVREALAA
ncbi:MAG: tRNA 2-thiouridine(34) synthase MnmA [Chloroflexi bacterium]|nr:tRNA 2-thiouridine(34) synthase MnmA [Chloroflexota bacterium]